MPLQAYDFTVLPISPTGKPRDGNQELVVLHNCSSVPWNPFHLLGDLNLDYNLLISVCVWEEENSSAVYSVHMDITFIVVTQKDHCKLLHANGKLAKNTE